MNRYTKFFRIFQVGAVEKWLFLVFRTTQTRS